MNDNSVPPFVFRILYTTKLARTDEGFRYNITISYIFTRIASSEREDSNVSPL